MKAHLCTTEHPIAAGGNVIADCGKPVKNAQIAFLWDEAAMGEGLTYGKNVCQKCQLADKGPREKMLVYGISSKEKE